MSLIDRFDAVLQKPALARLRSRTRHLVVRALGASGHLNRAMRVIAASGDITVLTLHRIVPDAQLGVCCSPRGMVLRESLFAQLIQYLHRNTHVVSPHEAETKSPQSRLPRVLVTFDDGWIDNIDVALPYLDASHVRACFFVVTSLMGQTAPFWPEALLGLVKTARERGRVSLLQSLLADLLHTTGIAPIPSLNTEAILLNLKQLPAAVVRQWIVEARAQIMRDPTDSQSQSPHDPNDRLMSWEQAQSLLDFGHSVSSHTCTHPILPQLQARALREELHASRAALLDHLNGPGEADPWLSYPNGSVDSTVLRAAFDAGYRHGFTNSPGLWRPQTHPLLLPRVNVWDGTLLDEEGRFCEKRLEYSLFWRTNRVHAVP